MAKTYNQKINRNTAWGGDMSTSGLPVAGGRVQEFIKEELNGKAGAFYRPSGGNFVYCFATKEDRDTYADASNKDEYEHLIIDRFETESNYSVYINQDTLVLSKSVIEGSTGNTVEFQFKITDKNGMVSDSKASIVFTFLASGILKKYTTEVQVKSEGWTTVVSDVIDEYLRNGENNISVTITGLSTKTSTQFVMTYNVFDLEFKTMFQYNVPKYGSVLQVPYYIKCTETKYLEFYIDGYEVESVESQTISDAVKDGTANISIGNLEIGQHSLQVRAYVRAKDGTKFYSQIHYYTFAKEGNTTPSFLMSIKLDNTQDIAVDGNLLTINSGQFEQISFDWSMYDYLSRKLVVNFEYDGNIISKNVFTLNGTISEFSFRPFNYGDDKYLRIFSVDEDNNIVFEHNIVFNVAGNDSGLKETVDGLLLKLTSNGRRNTDEDKDVWSCVGNDQNVYSANFHNFAWNAQQGWNPEYEALVVSDQAYVDFNIRPMMTNNGINNAGWEENGGTFEIDLETFDIEDENAVICECKSNIEGKSTAYFRITATNAEFSTADGKKINTRYKDNERLKIAFIGNKKGTHEDGNMIYIMVNGVLERAAMYSNTDRIWSDEILRIGSGNGGCKIRVRSIRVYDRAISVDEEFNNYVVDSENSQIIYEKNNIFKKGTNEVGFDEVANKLPVMIFTGNMNDLVKNGQDKQWRYFDVEYINRQEPERNFVSFNCQMKLQGTSSLGYPRKNFKLKTKDKLATKEYYESSNYVLDTEETEVGNRRLRSKVTGNLIDFGDFTGNCFTFGNFSSDNPLKGELLKKGKYRFRANSHKADKWTLKADYMESSCSHNVGAGRSWNDIFENTELKISNYAGYVNNTYKDTALVNRNDYSEYTKNGISYKINMNTDSFRSQKNYVCRTDAQKICWSEGADDVRTAIDGFPMVCFYRTSHAENNLVFMGQYNFVNDKGSYEVFGFEDIEDPNNEDVMIYDASQVECWEGLKNSNPISLFKTIEGWNDPDGWKSTFESRYPDPDDEGVAGKRQVDGSVGSPLYELCKWLVSTRHESDTVYGDTLDIDSSFATRINGYQYAYVTGQEQNYEYASGVNLPDNAENRQKKFETEKWEHFDVWKLAGYYIYLMRYGAVDQFVKNTMLFTDGNGRYDNRTDKKYRKWFYINYDNDCLFGLRNNGELAFHWKLDRQTIDNANDIIVDENDEYNEGNVNTYAMMGHDSTLWNNLERDDEFMRMVRDLDDSMNKSGLNYENMVTEFDTKQTEMWCERIYNANERYKYIQAAKGVGDMAGNPVDNLWMLQGTRRSHRHWWIANHFNMLDARWLSGDYKNTYVQIKTDSPAGSIIRAVAGDDYYFAWGQQKRIYESNIQKEKGEEIEFVFPTDQVQGDPVYIYAYNKMSELDFSAIANKIAAGSFEFNEGGLEVVNTLKKLVIGNQNVINRIELPTTTWGKLKNLEYLDITNYAGIKEIPFDTTIETENGEITHLSLPNLHTLKAFGSGLSSFVPVEGSNFNLAELPASVSTIKLNNVNFNNITEDFKYVPTTNLTTLEISNTNGIKMAYFRKIVEPWLNAMNSSISSDALYASAKLVLNNVDWSFDKFSDIELFENISKVNGAFVISGVIDLSTLKSISMENIEKIKQIFGENCFNKVMSAIYIKVPETVFIHTDSDSMVAGKTNVFYREIYPAENAITMDHSIVYNIVEECSETTPGAIHDTITNKYYIIVSDISSIRQGTITFENLRDENNKEIAVLTSEENEISDTDLKIMCTLSMGGVSKVSVCDFKIKKPTYASSVVITGNKSIYKNGEYVYEAVLKDNLGNAPIGTENVTWTLSMNNAERYLVSYENVDENGIRYKIVTSENEPNEEEVSETINLSIIVEHGNGRNPLIASYVCMLLNENVIMTSVSNPIMMERCYNAFDSVINRNAMTKAQAESVTDDDIDGVFSGIASEFTFNEFKYFTGITRLPSGAFGDCRRMTEITLPSTIVEIGPSAFSNCQRLTKISTGNDEYTLPNINIINERTFIGCEYLKKLKLPNTIKEIKDFSFGGTGFRKVLLSTEELNDEVLLLPSEIEIIRGNAFETSNWSANGSNNKLTVFSIPSTLSLSSNENVVRGRYYTEYISEPGNMNYITDDGVLYTTNNGYDKYELVKYPAAKNENFVETITMNGIRTFYNYAFLYCGNIGTVVIPNTILNYNIGSHCFEKSTVRIIDARDAQFLSSIPDYCFYDCLSLTDVFMPIEPNIREIGAYAFYNCPSLTGLTLPDGIEKLGYYEVSGRKEGNNFYNCGFHELLLPDTIKTYGRHCITNCQNIEYLKLGKYMVLTGDEFVTNCKNLSEVVLPIFSYYSFVSYEVYDSEGTFIAVYDNEEIALAEQENYPGGEIRTVYGENIVNNTNMDYRFIIGCVNLMKFSIADGDNSLVGCIYDNALYNVVNNTLIKVPFGVYGIEIMPNTTAIGPGAFMDCSRILEVTLMETINSIGNDSFNGCSSISLFKIIDGINTIPDRCFRNCSNLRTLFVSKDVNTISFAAFAGCTKLSEIYFFRENACNLRCNAIGFDYHPFGSSNSEYAGYEYRNNGTNKLYISYNANGYDNPGTGEGSVKDNRWVGNPITNTSMCGYSYEPMKINSTFVIKIYDETNELVTNNVYAVSQSMNFISEGVYVSVSDGHVFAALGGENETLYHGEILEIYSDPEHVNKIGEINMDYNTKKYQIGEPSYGSRMLKSENPSEDDTVVISKNEYNNIISNIELLNKIIFGK